MKYFCLVILFLLFSCGNRENILLPRSNVTVVSDVKDHSPIYIFFRIEGKDTLAEVNRKNSIISTNWILNIDKRLPLRLVITEVMKLQEKKRNEVAHKNALAENYYSYADSIGRNLAFMPFSKVYYILEKPNLGVIVYFGKKNRILVDSIEVQSEKLESYLENLPSDKPLKFNFCFDKNMGYGSYIQHKIFISNLKIENKEEFIF